MLNKVKLCISAYLTSAFNMLLTITKGDEEETKRVERFIKNINEYINSLDGFSVH
mgnify:CR=1 FL=1